MARRAVLCAVVALLFAVPLARAQTIQPVAYLPFLFTPPELTQPSGACAQGAPEIANGSQAWVTNLTPNPNTIETVCVRLVLNDQAINGAPVTIVVHYPTKDSTYTGATSDAGTAPISFNIGNEGNDYTAGIDTTITYNGQDYTAQTSFLVCFGASALPSIIVCG